MTIEYLDIPLNVESVLTYIHQKYSVNEQDVNLVIEEAVRAETKYIKAASQLMIKVHGIAEKVGIVHNLDYPQSHLPTMLAAVKVLEMDIPSDEKQLTTKKTLELLATGEITSAHASANRLRSFEGVRGHLDRAVKLLKFREDLERK